MDASSSTAARGRLVRIAPWLAGSASLALSVAGFVVMTRYASTPGPAEAAPRQWPSEAAVVRASDRPTVIVFAHPLCPCTRASIDELGRIAARIEGRARIVVMLASYGELDVDVEAGELATAARAIPGVEVVADPDAAAAASFGARTSGHTLVYGGDGGLLFEGGITLARGHAGDNPGARDVIEAVLAGRGARRVAPVFGCALEGGRATEVAR